MVPLQCSTAYSDIWHHSARHLTSDADHYNDADEDDNGYDEEDVNDDTDDNEDDNGGAEDDYDDNDGDSSDNDDMTIMMIMVLWW